MRPSPSAFSFSLLASLTAACGSTTAPASAPSDGGAATTLVTADASNSSGSSGGGNGGSSSSGAPAGSSSSSGGVSAGGGSGSSSGGGSSSSGSGGGQDSGMAGVDGAPPDSGGASGCDRLALCENFDSQSAGSPPSPSLWSLIGDRTCSTQAAPWPFAVDTAQSHSPPNSMKVSGGDSCGPIMLNASAFSKLSGTDVYGRFYVRLSDTSMTFDHAVLMTLGFAAGADAGLNLGNQSTYLQLASEGAGNPTNVLMWQTSDGNLLPDKNTMGGAQSTYPQGSAWTCVEFHTSSKTGAIEAWVNSAAVPGLTFVPGTTATVASVNDQWKAPSPFAPTSIGFGWVVFSGPAMTLWFDDIAVANTRIGCQ